MPPACATYLASEGAELVLHGHNHRQMLNVLAGRDGNIPIIGVPSASMNDTGHAEPAAWNLYEISRNQGTWADRGFDPGVGSHIPPDGAQKPIHASFLSPLRGKLGP